MTHVVITGASRGIGAALARAVAARGGHTLWLVARDAGRLREVASAVSAFGAAAEVVSGDLSSLAGARELGAELARRVPKGSTLVHNAGLWPIRRVLTEDGLEEACVVNHLGPLAMQTPLIDGGRLRRIMTVSAGLVVLGRFDPDRTPTGDDFSSFRTYCTTKLALAVAMRGVAREHPELDVVVLHPGVVRTDLGARSGVVGWLLDLAKRRWEHPATCAERLADMLEESRWSPEGEATWRIESDERPWPEVVTDEATAASVARRTRELLGVAVEPLP